MNSIGQCTIRVIVDNRAELPLMAEHGYAALLETEDKKILFDTGQGRALYDNAEKMDISLTDIDALILSHGHYDHSGNIASLIGDNRNIEFFAHPDCLQERFSYHEGEVIKSVGLTERDREVLMGLPPDQLHWSTGRTEITKGIYITGFVPREHELEDTGGDFYLDREMTKSDIIRDDLSLWVEGDRGLTVLCGCCHSGLQNTLNHISSFYETPRFETLMGGFHLKNSSDARIESSIKFLKELAIDHIIAGHCTGDKALKRFYSAMSSSFSDSKAGLSLIVHMHS